MSFDLCMEKKAEHPFFIESIGIRIYTIEELCWFLHNNLYGDTVGKGNRLSYGILTNNEYLPPLENTIAITNEKAPEAGNAAARGQADLPEKP